MIRSALLTLAVSVISAGTARAQTACAAMTGFTAPDVKITAAAPLTDPVPLCKVEGLIGTEIRFAVWLPDTWNGKFVMGGQGGFAGTVESQALAFHGPQQGYAVAGTDTGHAGDGVDGRWALGHPERVVNYAHAAIHRVTVTAKAIVQARYGRAPGKAYFTGCSNGGRQALMSAQRYPDDFDAILAGAPAQDWRGLIAAFLTITKAMYPDPGKLTTPTLSIGDQQAIQKAVLAACDRADGLADGVMTDPSTCRFDPKVLACRGENQDGCLSPAEIAAVETITKGPMLDGKPYFVGFPFGAEADPRGWGGWLVGPGAAGATRPTLAYGFGLDFERYFVRQDPTWSYTDFDLARFTTEMKDLQPLLSPLDPDLSAFRRHGGKLLLYHGWSDAALSPFMTTRYVDAVVARDAGAKADVRLFLLPGVMHCFGGPGPDRVDWLGALDAWAGGGKAPDELTAGFATGGARKVCAYPKKAVFSGSGDGKSPDQFECR